MKKIIKNKFSALLALGVVLAVLLLVFNRDDSFEASDGEKNREVLVITTLFPLYSFAEALLPEKFKVELLSLSSDAHTFSPKPSDIAKLNSADVFIYSSDFLETWSRKVIKNLPDNVLVLNASYAFEWEEDFHREEAHSHHEEGHHHEKESHHEEEHHHEKESHHEEEHHHEKESHHEEGHHHEKESHHEEEHHHEKESHHEEEHHHEKESHHEEGHHHEKESHHEEEHHHEKESHHEEEHHHEKESHHEEEHHHEKESHHEEGHNHEGENSAGAFDPHYWLDFSLNLKVVEHLASKFEERYPQEESFINENKKQLMTELTALDNDYREALASCQSKDLYFIGHSSFSYLLKRYGITYFPMVENFSSQAEVLTGEFVAFIDQIREKDIKYVFYEQYETLQKSVTIAEDLKIDLLPLNAGNLITKEELAKDVSFTDLMRRNLVEFKRGLICR